MRTRAVALAVAAAALGWPAGVAAASGIYQRVLSTYESLGSVPPCHFTSPQLEAALRGEDAYGAQYFADFSAAIETALAQRAGGACARGARARARRRPVSLTGPTFPLPSSPTSPTSGSIPAPLWVMGGLALLAATLAGLPRLVRALGWQPGWARAWRHAYRDAAFHAGGRVAALRDAVRAAGRVLAPRDTGHAGRRRDRR